MTSTNHPLPLPLHLHPQKWAIDLLFKNNSISKYVTNLKTSPPPLPTNVINVWVIIRRIFKKCEWRDRILQSLNLLFLSVTRFSKCLIFDSIAKRPIQKPNQKPMVEHFWKNSLKNFSSSLFLKKAPL